MKIKIISIIAGMGLGWLYYHFVGCMGGSCPITSNPISSMIFGAIFSYLLFPDIVEKLTKKENKDDQSE